MKRGWKIFWIVCGVCVGAGLVCCMIAFVLGVSLEAIEDGGVCAAAVIIVIIAA